MRARTRRLTALLFSLPALLAVTIIFPTSPARADGLGPLAVLSLELGEPSAAVQTIESELVINGRASDGSIVSVYDDVDFDGQADGAAVASQQLSSESRLFEFHVPLPPQAETRFLVQADRDGLESALVATPSVVRLPTPVVAAELSPTDLQVRVSSTDLAANAKGRLAERLRSSGIPAARLTELFSQHTDPLLGRWLYLRVSGADRGRAMQILHSDRDVDLVEQVPLYTPDFVPNDTRRADQWYLNTIRAIDAWDLGRSTAATQIAILDTQFDNLHPDLNGKFDGVAPIEAGCPVNVQPYWHGTAVASDAAALTNNGQGIAGIGFDAHLLGYQLGIAVNGQCLISGQFVAAITQATDAGADVINMSFGSPNTSQAERDAVRYAANRGVLLVASAGNNGDQVPQFPASDPEVMSIAATQQNELRAGFSSFGPTLSLAAPGDGILGAMPQGDPNAPYAFNAGTSFAAPITAGAGALVGDRWTVRGLRVRHRLQDGADTLPNYPGDFNNDVGNGRLNIFRAMSEKVIRLAGLDRQRTAGEIAREAAAIAPPGRTDILNTVVLINADEPNGWVDTLASGPLLNRYGSVYVATRADRLDAIAESEINRLFGTEGTDFTKTILIPGGPGGSVSAAVEAQLAQRFTVRRLAGANRFATAAAISNDTLRPGITDAIVTRGDVFADALAMAGVAARRGFPMLFVDAGTTVPVETCNWFTSHPQITTIHLAGGTAAISPLVALQLASGCGATRTVNREAGVDRFDTAVQIAQIHFPDPDGFVVAYGYGWPDAIAGAGLSRVFNAPILLTDFDSLHPTASSYIRSTHTRRPSINVGWVLGGNVTTVSANAEATFEAALQ